MRTIDVCMFCGQGDYNQNGQYRKIDKEMHEAIASKTVNVRPFCCEDCFEETAKNWK